MVGEFVWICDIIFHIGWIISWQQQVKNHLIWIKGLINGFNFQPIRKKNIVKLGPFPESRGKNSPQENNEITT